MLERIVSAEHFLEGIFAVLKKPDALPTVLDALPAPVYLTDAEGVVTYFNQACIGFSGREPQAGKDRWCVTWKLFTDSGEALPHDQCPMAAAVRSREKIRGVTAYAERPDGTRVQFMPFPTPLFSQDGEFQGAVNLLIDITEKEQAGDLRVQAARCRRLATASGDPQLYKTLNRLASQYEVKAIAIDLLPA